MQIFEIETDNTLRSLAPYGASEFQFECFLDEVERYKHHSISYHWHNEFQFAVISEGFTTCTIEDNYISLKKGEGIFINSGVIHRFDSIEKCKMKSVIFSPDLLSPKQSSIYEKFVIPVLISNCKFIVLKIEVDWQEQMLEMINLIYNRSQQYHQIQELRILILVLSLWELFYKNIQWDLMQDGNQSNALVQSRMHKMLDYIRCHYGGHITLDLIASSASVSKSEALRCFRHSVKSTPISYLAEYRLKIAQDKLRFTSDSVSEIATSVGFDNSGYFSRVFKRKFGLTPLEFRKSSLS